MKKILFVSSSAAGGAERMTVLYSKILKRYGFDCSFLIASFGNKPLLITAFLPQGLKYDILRFRYKILITVQFFMALLKIRPDIVFCSQPGNSAYILKLRRLHLLPSKFVYREFLMPSDHLSQVEKREKDLKLADEIIAQTVEMKNEMVKYYHLDPTRIKVVNNPIDTELIRNSIVEEYPFDHTYTNYIAINRVTPQKDMMTMLRAFEIVKSEKPNSRLYICGDISDEQYLRELTDYVQSQCMGESVFFEGPQSNPFKYLNYADVFCLSSTYEGLPNGMLEAMYLGIPVAVTQSIPYITQVVEEGRHGFTAPVGNPEAFAQAMLKSAELKIKEKFVDINKSEEQICQIFSNLLK